MREKIKRPEKDRHEFAWNPEYGWQILRRCPSYIRAVEVFLKEARKANDKDSLAAFEVISFDEEENSKLPLFSSKKIWTVRRGTKNRKQLLRDQDLSFDFPNIPIFRRRGLGDKNIHRYSTVDTGTKHYQRFYKWYGDLLLFPIDPKTVKPRIETLSSLWSLYSIKISEDMRGPLFDTKNEHLIQIKLTINSSFSRTVIKDDFERFLKSKLDGKSMITEKPRWSSQAFDEYLSVMDAAYKNGKRTKLTYREIGELCAPERARNNVRNRIEPGRGIIDWARDTLRYVEEKLIPIFDRPEKPNKRGVRRAGL